MAVTNRFLIWTFVLLLGAFAPQAWAADDEGGEGDKPAKPIYHPLEPPFVTNLMDEGRMRFMQVKVQLMTRDAGAVEKIEHHRPALRDALLMLLAHQDIDLMRTTQGREAVRQQALEKVRTVLEELTGKPLVEAVYFTDFVIQ